MIHIFGRRVICHNSTLRVCRPWPRGDLVVRPNPTFSALNHLERWQSYRAVAGEKGDLPFTLNGEQEIMIETRLNQDFIGTITGPSRTRSSVIRVLRLAAVAVFFTSAGFIIAIAPAIPTINGMITPPTDAESLTIFQPTDELSIEVDRFLNSHPLAVHLRADPDFSESRPHMKIPEAQRRHNLTGGTLVGARKIVVPPVSWTEKGGNRAVSIFYLGTDLCGHPDIIHGGLLATILDEGLARCCFPALPNKIGMTANLNINYRKPAPAGSFLVLKAKTIKVEGRKAWVEGCIETLVGEGEQPIVLAEASALFVEPREAASMAKIYSVA